MCKTILSVVAIFVLVSCAYAQPRTPDERVRTSTIVPDLHNPASGWKAVPEKVELFYQNQALTVRIKLEYYENTKDGMRAFLHVLEAKGGREELAMLYGTDNVARGAIRVGGAWHVSKDLYFDNGKDNPGASVSWVATFDEKEPDKPTKAKLTLETVDGHKEVVIDLQ